MPKKHLDARQMLALTVSERTMSVLSIVGSLFIMITFTRWHYFRKPINRLVFYASFGNVMANVATLISTSAIPPKGTLTPLCEFQGIFIQWFMMADSLWVFCMALNVLLVFFRNFDTRQLRHLEKWYMLFSYGVPFIPCLVYILLDHFTETNIIGGATIWCWVDAKVEWMRIAFFYVPVWIVVCLTLLIYISVGYHIFQRRAALRSFTRQTPVEPVSNPFRSSIMNRIECKTEIHVTSNTIDSDCTAVCPSAENDSRESFSSTRNLSANVQAPAPPVSPPSRFARVNWPSASRAAAEDPTKEIDEPLSPSYKAAISVDNNADDIEMAPVRSMSATHSITIARRNVAIDGNSAAWSYFKVAFLMFAALFIVWVPSTVNRLQQFIQKDNPIFGLNLASALVLPLQGFWNSMVYVSTTWPECKRAIAEIMEDIRERKRRASQSQSESDRQRKDSENTLTAAGNPSFEVDVSMRDVLKQGPTGPPAPHPPPSLHLHSRMSSTESMKSPSASRQGRR